MGEPVEHTKLVLELLNKQRLEADSSCDVFLYPKKDGSKQDRVLDTSIFMPFIQMSNRKKFAAIRAHRSLLSLNPTIYSMLTKGIVRQKYHFTLF